MLASFFFFKRLRNGKKVSYFGVNRNIFLKPPPKKTIGQPTRLVGRFFLKNEKNVFSKTLANEKPTIFRWPTDGRFFFRANRGKALRTDGRAYLPLKFFRCLKLSFENFLFFKYL